MEIDIAQTVIFIAILIVTLVLGNWIFIGLILTSMLSLFFLAGMPLKQISAVLGGNLWSSATRADMAAIPLFIWMGEVLFRTNLSDRLFRGLAPWVSLLPGRLLHTTVLGCALFAAVCGSSTATTATVGKMTANTLVERGYAPGISIGSLAGAGTLGLMIPPSIALIVYGVLADTSIARLFAAGLVPGLMIAVFYTLYIIIVALVRPSVVPARELQSYGWKDRWNALYQLSPIIALIIIVMGSIYTGIATPTESAAVGLAFCILTVIALGEFNFKLLTDSLFSSLAITCMIVTIIVGASILSSMMSYLQIPQNITAFLSGIEMNAIAFVMVIFIFYIILGTVLEGTSMMVVTLPIVIPLALSHGFDRVWLGVFLVISIEIAQITPPVGFNLFVIQTMTNRSIGWIAWHSIPFCLLLILSALLIAIFPSIALWLPNYLYN